MQDQPVTSSPAAERSDTPPVRLTATPPGQAPLLSRAPGATTGPLHHRSNWGVALRRRWSSLLAVALLLVSLLPIGRAAAGPTAQLANVEAMVNGEDDLNVRAGPSLGQPIVGTLRAGSRLTVVNGPVAADGWNWCELGAGGWVVCEPLIDQQGVSILFLARAGAAVAGAPAAPAAPPPAAAAPPTTAATAPARPPPPAQTAVSLPLPGGTMLIPSPTIRLAATPTLIVPRPPVGGNPTPALPPGVGTSPTPFSALPQAPPGLMPGAPPGGVAIGTPSPTPLIRLASPGPQAPGTGPMPIGPSGVTGPQPGQGLPPQVPGAPAVPGQVPGAPVAPGQVPGAPIVPGQVPGAPVVPGQVPGAPIVPGQPMPVPPPGVITPGPMPPMR